MNRPKSLYAGDPLPRRAGRVVLQTSVAVGLLIVLPVVAAGMLVGRLFESDRKPDPRFQEDEASFWDAPDAADEEAG